MKKIILMSLLVALTGCGGASDDVATDESNLNSEDDSATGNSPNLELPIVELSGTWNGILTQSQGGTRPQFNYEISIERTGNGQFTGTSKITVIQNSEYYGVMYLTGSIEDSVFKFQEGSLIENSPEPGTYWCIKSGELNLESNQMKGDWSAPGCAPGQIHIEKSASVTRWFEKLPDCPCMFDESIDGKREANKVGVVGTWSLSNSHLDAFHPGASNAVRWGADAGGSGQQCTYNENGLLITGGLGAGTPDFVSSEDSIYYHWMEDVLPFQGSVLLDLISGETDFGVFTCEQYFEIYPPNQGSQCGFTNYVNIPSFSRARTESCRAIIDSPLFD